MFLLYIAESLFLESQFSLCSKNLLLTYVCIYNIVMCYTTSNTIYKYYREICIMIMHM